LTNYDFYRPTNDEIERGVVISPPRYWGFEMFRKSTPSVRILALGGSNTASPKGYVPFLESLIIELFPDDSYVINAGMAGTPPVKRIFGFESNLPPEKWPNLITLEYSVNCPSGWDCVIALDSMINFINRKYQRRNIPLPSYLIFELFRVGSFYSKDWESTFMIEQYDPACDHIVIKNNPNITQLFPPSLSFGSDGFNRGTNNGPYFSALARFYRIPLISAADVLWPSFIRYYKTHPTCAKWPFTYDGVHISELGSLFMMNYVFRPFFQKLAAHFHHFKHDLTPAEREAHYKYFMLSKSTDENVRMFPLSVYLGSVVAEYNSWGTGIRNSLVDAALSSSEHFDFQPLSPKHDDQAHVCFGSTSPRGIARFLVAFPDQFYHDFLHKENGTVDHSRFHLALSMVHSWDSSMIGDVSCQLYQLPDSLTDQTHQASRKFLETTFKNGNNNPEIYSNPLFNQPLVIRGNQDPAAPGSTLKDTTPRITELTENISLSKYLLECKKLDERLSCFTRIALSEQ
jgi:hypothetical protein